MNRAELLEKIRKVVAENLNVDEAEIDEETKFIDDLGADSLDLVDLVMALETELGVTIEDEKLNSISKVKDVLDLVEEKLAS
ncbi:MAG: acyl carrier protein [Thermotogaceae bacterium]|jgi:acyl carrier protein|nr:acyl carrier protein [Thermotogaceae bacterium]MDN5337312.1 acyl carrier protein [Thermotogaceae bacterium]